MFIHYAEMSFTIKWQYFENVSVACIWENIFEILNNSAYTMNIDLCNNCFIQAESKAIASFCEVR